MYVSQIGRLPREVPEIGQKTAAGLLRSVGVNLRFIHAEADALDGDAIGLRLLARAPEGVPRGALANALIVNRRGVEAVVYYDRVTEFFHSGDSQAAGVLLGYVIAHEIGHVLQGHSLHSTGGVMKARWNVHDLSTLLQRQLMFYNADARAIRESVAARRVRRLAAARPAGE